MSKKDPSDARSRAAGFISGTLSGLTKLVVGHPFDTIKTRCQVAPPGTFQSPLDALLQLIRKEGPRAVYKGGSAPAIGWAVSDSTLMGSLTTYRLAISRLEGGLGTGAGDVAKLSLLGHGIAGSLAGMTVCFVVTPAELLKSKLQMQMDGPKIFSGPIDCARQIIRHNGIRGMYRGFPATLLFRAWFGPFFVAYELAMRRLRRTQLSKGTTNFIAGGLSSIVFWSGSFAFDSVKSRLMSDSITEPRYKNWMAAAKQIHSEGDLRAFYRGLSPCLLRAIPTNAAALFVWETSMRHLGCVVLFLMAKESVHI